MKPRLGRFVPVFVLALGVAGCTSLPESPRAQLGGADEPEPERRILVTVRQPSELSTALLGPPGERYRRRRGYEAAPGVERTLSRLAREHGLVRLEGWPIASLDVYCEVFGVRPGVAVDGLLERLAEDPRVDLAQRMQTFETLGDYDDTYAGLQPAMTDLEVESAHELATGRGVTVAVIDSGIDVRHPELAGRIVLERDLVEAGRTPPAGEVHGTAVAGVIASAANNREGIVGIAPDVTIAALRACRAEAPGAVRARCSTLSLARALDLALRVAPNVVNLSLNGPPDPLLSRLLARLVERGVVVVTARPERADAPAGFPWSAPGVLVAQPPEAGRGAPGGAHLLGAPAREILTTTPAAGYAFLSGSSLAAAHVSGVASLLMEREPRLGAERIAAVLRDTATYEAGRETVNACRALASLTGAAACRPAVEAVTAEGESRTTGSAPSGRPSTIRGSP